MGRRDQEFFKATKSRKESTMRKNIFRCKVYAGKAFSLVGAILIAASIVVASNAPVAQAQSSLFSLPSIDNSSGTPKTNSSHKKKAPVPSKDVIKLVPYPSKITYFEGVASIRLPWNSPEGYPLAGCDFYRDRPESSGCGNVKVRKNLSPLTSNTGWAFGRFAGTRGGSVGIRTDAPWFNLDTTHVMKEGEKVIFDSYSCDFKSDLLTCVDADTGTKVKVSRKDVVVS